MRLQEGTKLFLICLYNAVIICAQDPNAFPMFLIKTTLSPILQEKMEVCRGNCGDKYYTCAVTKCENEACEDMCLLVFRSCYNDCDQRRPPSIGQLHARPSPIDSYVIRQ
ncbi:uncharacterized protein LOC134262713 [Saccostrea cucullata]|uniref:uncharacterized protein LOC134262713 n=1 Tax=Saccostrea cuccullata TaxID=36930 RepID=UPI002ED33267